MKAKIGTLVAMFFLMANTADTAVAEDCPLFSEPLENSAQVTANGGAINGSVSFIAAVNGNGACFGAGESIRYSDSIFNAATGSMSLWFKKSGTDVSGGIVQIGRLGHPASLGVFFNSTDILYVEIRNDMGRLYQIYETSSISDSEYVHMVVTWNSQTDGILLKLFLNGEFKQNMLVSGTLTPSSETLDFGSTGFYGSAMGCIDEFAFFDRPLPDSEIYAEYVVSANRQNTQQGTRPVSTGPVQIVDGSLLVHGKPFLVKGVGYQPTPIGLYPNSSIYTDACILDRDIPLIRAIGANTVRLWATLPTNEILLDKLYNGGISPIYAILSFWVDPGLDYSDPVVKDSLESDFRDFVNNFKGHPAVLAWAIGNEVNLAHSWPASMPPIGPASEWYALANDLAAAAHEEEGSAYHPTMIINGGLQLLGDTRHESDDVSLDHVDLWGINAYFGNDNHCFFDYYQKLSSKPLIITEFGVDAYDNHAGTVDEQAQADWDVLQWQMIAAKSLGGTVMAYSDEWWKDVEGGPALHDPGGYYSGTGNDGFSNEEYYGLVSVADMGGACDAVSPRLAYTALKEQWLNTMYVTLSKGYNLISHATVPPPNRNTARQWLALIGDENEITAIERYNTATGTMERAGYHNDVDFPIQPKQAYVLHMKTPKTIRLEGDSRCVDLGLTDGLNLVGYPHPVADTTCFGWLEAMGSANVGSIQRFKGETGKFETCGYCDNGVSDNALCGIDFIIDAVTGYQIYVKNSFRFGCQD